MDDRNFLIAEVVVDLPLEGPFDYAVPERLRPEVMIGRRVSVLFNRAKRVGFIVGIKTQSDFGKLNWILAVLDQDGVALDELMMALAKNLAEYYGCSLGQALFTMLPPLARQNRDLVCSFRPHHTNVSSTGTNPSTLLLHDLDEQQSRFWIQQRIEDVLARGQRVLVLVPEAHDVSGVKDWLESVLGRPVYGRGRNARVAQAEAEWQATRSGEISVLVGTRSAVFSPLPGLGLIVISQEDHNSYQEEQSPYYHVREVVRMRQSIEHCDVVFWSSAPSVETWRALQDRPLEKVVFTRPVAPFKVVDMSNYNPRKTSLLSSPTQNCLQECLRSGGRALFIVQSRDFQPWTHPVDGQAVRAKAEKVEAEIRRFYGEYSFERCDNPRVNFKPRAKIVLAPPSILKSRHLWRPEMIGVIRPDAQMYQFDFRSSQRVFSFFVQLCLWAGETVMIQTMLRDQHPVRAAELWDFEYFYREELRQREDLDLPPVKHMVSAQCRGLRKEQVLEYTQQLYQDLAASLVSSATVQVPFRKEETRSSGQDVMVILCKDFSVEPLVRAVKAVVGRVKKPHGVLVSLTVDK